MTEGAGACLNRATPCVWKDFPRDPIVGDAHMMHVSQISATLIGETGHSPRNIEEDRVVLEKQHAWFVRGASSKQRFMGPTNLSSTSGRFGDIFARHSVDRRTAWHAPAVKTKRCLYTIDLLEGIISFSVVFGLTCVITVHIVHLRRISIEGVNAYPSIRLR